MKDITGIIQNSRPDDLRSLLAYTIDRSINEIYIFDAETLQFLYVNDGALRNLGYTPEKILTMTPVDIKPDLTCETFLDMVQPLFKNEKDALIFETRHLRADNSTYPVEVHLQLMRHSDRRVFLAVILDISERKKAESQLRESAERYRSLFEKHSAVMLLLDPETGDIVDTNHAAAAFYGWSMEELKKMNIRQINTLSPQEIEIEMRKAVKLERNHFEFRHRRADGSIRDVETYSSRIMLNGKNYLHSIIHDVTEKKRLQDQFRQAQKMEAIGTLAGGVAHDFNNMLSVILGHVELALNSPGKTDDITPSLLNIKKAAQHSAELTRQLLTFARKQSIEPKIVDINRTVEGMLKMVRRIIGENIDLQWLPGKDIWKVSVDPSQIDQILANLCVNSRDAISGTGRIVIETSNVTLQQQIIEPKEKHSSGSYVMLSVSDDGSGMDKDTLEHLFEPFFTTKGSGHGTGLGLATVYGAVKQNSGLINVYSEPSRGTTFKIYFPRVESADALPETTVQETGTIKGQETILIVEDEPAILEIASMMLDGLGYKVLTASRPSEAIKIADESSNHIDLLLTDIIMPEMDGKSMAQNILQKHPLLKCIYMSGYTANIILHTAPGGDADHFLQKPFSMNELALKVRKVLDTK